MNRADRIVPAMALVAAAVEWLPGIVGPSGYFIDETYFIACAERLAWGYVDHPPFSIALLRIVLETFGDSIAAIRIVPACAAAATVVLTSRLARRLGANEPGQILAALAVSCAPVYQIVFGFYSMNSLAILLWLLAFTLLVEITRRSEPRLWILFGALAGIALLNKHTFLLLGAGLAVGLLIDGRHHLLERHVWIGLALAVLIAAPNFAWQAANDFASLEFYRLQDLKNVATPPLAVLQTQILGMNPFSLPLWAAGLWFFFGSDAGRPYRHVGWIPVVLLALMLIGQKSRPDRIAAMYTLLFAAGGVVLGEFYAARRWLAKTHAALLLAVGLLLAPLSLPLLPTEATAKLSAALGVVPQVERGPGKVSRLPQWLADRYGWEALTQDVANAFRSLDEGEQRKAVIVTSSYGNGAPVALLGKEDGLPPLYSRHNNYFLWGPPPDPVEVAILVGFGERDDLGEMQPDPVLRELFEQMELAGVHQCEWCMSWRNDEPIWVVRGPKGPVGPRWAEFKLYR